MWYRKAADQGDAKAQSNLGAMYCHGQGVAQSYKETAVWFRKAADQGHGRRSSIWAKYTAMVEERSKAARKPQCGIERQPTKEKSRRSSC